MKKFILSALVLAALNLSAGSIGIKPIVNSPNCYGASTGTITLVVVGANGPVTYAWSNSLPAVYQQTGLAAGPYSVTVTDSTNAQATYSLVMSQPDSLNLSTTAQNVSVHGGSDGCVHLTVTGGTPDYSYAWSDNSTIESPCGLAAGTYTVTVTDAFNCTSSTSKTIYEPAIVVFHTNNASNHQASVVTTNALPGGLQLRSDMIGNVDNTTAGTASLEAQTAEIQIYPNPASDFVKLNIQPVATSEIIIYNTMGQIAMQRITDATETTLDISNLAKGNYIVMVKNENGTTNKKMTIVK